MNPPRPDVVFKPHGEVVNAVLFAQDGNRLLTGSGNPFETGRISFLGRRLPPESGEVGVWDAHSGELHSMLKLPGVKAICLALSGNDETVAIGTGLRSRVVGGLI